MSNFLLILEDGETGESYNVLVSKEEHDRACTDLMYAAKLLECHKKTIAQQKTHSIQTAPSTSNSDASNLLPLKVLDDMTKESYTILLNQVDYHKAMQDPGFAYKILHEHKIKYSLLPTKEVVNVQSFEKELAVSIEKGNVSETEEIVDELGGEWVDKENGRKGKRDPKNAPRTEWSEPAIELLIARYEDLQESYDAGKLTHRKLMNLISRELKERNYIFSSIQCSDKMESLKKKHKQIKDWNSVSGHPKKTWIFYERLDKLFGNKPWNRPLSTAGSNIPLKLSDDSISPSSQCKRNKAAFEVARLAYWKDAIQERKLKRQATEEYNKQKLSRIDKFIEVFEKSKNSKP